MRRFLVLFAMAGALFFGIQEFEEYVSNNRRTVPPKERIAASIPPVSDPSIGTSPSFSKLVTAMEVAEEYLKAHRQEWKLQAHHEFRAVEFRTPLATKIKFTTYQEGVPILDLDISLQVEKDNTVTNVENRYYPAQKVDLKKKEIKVGELLPVVNERYSTLEEPSTVAAPVIMLSPGDKTPQVGYLLSVRDKVKNEVVEVLFRASDGQVLAKNRPRSEF